MCGGDQHVIDIEYGRKQQGQGSCFKNKWVGEDHPQDKGDETTQIAVQHNLVNAVPEKVLRCRGNSPVGLVAVYLVPDDKGHGLEGHSQNDGSDPTKEDAEPIDQGISGKLR